MQSPWETLQKMQAERRGPTPMGISPAGFKTLRLFITMVVAMLATSPPHQPDVDDEGDIAQKGSPEDAKIGNEGKSAPGGDTLVPERTILGLPHPGNFAGRHPWFAPTIAMIQYGSQIIILQLVSWDLMDWSPRSGTSIFAVDQIELAGMAMVVLGGMLRLWCYSEMEDMFTFQLTVRKEHKLITTGPYTYVRHPSYVGLLLLLLGFMTPVHLASKTDILTALLPFKVKPSIGIAAALVMGAGYVKVMNERAEVEEVMMGQHFGKEYDMYKKRTKKFVPFVW